MTIQTILYNFRNIYLLIYLAENYFSITVVHVKKKLFEQMLGRDSLVHGAQRGVFLSKKKKGVENL